jgi:hypothetical protein
LAPNTKEGRDHGGAARPDSPLQKSLQRFDDWFRYAETVGQQRLSGYLFTVSITLASFATLYSRNIFLLSVVVAVFGAAFSLAWAVVGVRQTKFHRMLEEQIDILIGQNRGAAAEFPIYYVRQLKCNQYKSEERIALSRWEHHLATRNFLFFVPGFFVVLYLVCTIFALRRLGLPYL